jgi:hypothetical protein
VRAEEISLQCTTIHRWVLKLHLARIADDVPIELHATSPTSKYVNHSRLRTLVNEVGFRQHTQSAVTVSVKFRSKLQDLLCCQIDVGRNYSKHDGPRIVHVAPHHVSHKLDVGLGRQALGGTLEDSRHVDDTEVLLFRTGDLEAGDIIREGGLPLCPIAFSSQTHLDVRLLRC